MSAIPSTIGHPSPAPPSPDQLPADVGEVPDTFYRRLIGVVPIPPVRKVIWLVPLLVVAMFVTFEAQVVVNDCLTVKADQLENPDLTGEDSSEGQSTPSEEHSITCFPEWMGVFALQKDNFTEYGVDKHTLNNTGAYVGKFLPSEPWRLVTTLFIHDDMPHLLLDLTTFTFVGVDVEQRFGSVRLLIVLFVPGIASSMSLHIFKGPTVVAVGFSGCILGLLAAMLAEVVTNWSLYGDQKGQRLFMVLTITLMYAVPSYKYATFGAYPVGILLGFILLPLPLPNRRNERQNPEITWIQKLLRIVASIFLCLVYLIFIAFFVKFVEETKKKGVK